VHPEGGALMGDVLAGLGALADSYVVLLFALPALAAYLTRPRVRENRLRLAAFFAALALVGLLVFALKEGYADRRPCAGDPSLLKLAACPGDYGFPSGHAAYAFVYAGASLGTSLFALFFPLAILVAASRVYVGVHTLNDIVAGMAIGLAAYFVIEGLLRERLPRLANAREHAKVEREKRGNFPRELARDALHASAGTAIILLALALGRDAAELLVLLALFLGMIVMHLRMRRVPIPFVDGVFELLERPRVIPAKGAFLYAIGCLLALSFLPHQAHALAAIAILAWGDSAATTAGEALGRVSPRWPHNPKKTLAGSAAFAAVGGAAAFAFVGPAGFAVALACALAETLDVGIDDNLLVPLAGIASFALLMGVTA